MPSNNSAKNEIAVVIFSHNAEKEIEDCIKSARLLTKKIYLVDIQSNDKTVEMAKNQKVVVFPFPFTNYVEPAREFGIKKAPTDWVFIIDTDERITEKLVKEICNPKFVIGQYTHYRIPRKNIFINQWLKHGGWWPDYQIRLINKKYLINWPKEIHSTPKIKGKCGILKQPFLHYFHGDFTSMVKKTIIFEEIESDLLFKAYKKTSSFTFFRKFLGELYRRLIKQLGFLDGTLGIMESIYQAFSKTITYLFLYEKFQSRSQRGSGKLDEKSRSV